VREPEEVEGLAATRTALLAQHSRKLAEVDEARLLLMERKPKLNQTRLEFVQHSPRVGFILKTHHEVVAVAHDDDSTARIPLAPLMTRRSSA